MWPPQAEGILHHSVGAHISADRMGWKLNRASHLRVLQTGTARSLGRLNRFLPQFGQTKESRKYRNSFHLVFSSPPDVDLYGLSEKWLAKFSTTPLCKLIKKGFEIPDTSGGIRSLAFRKLCRAVASSFRSY